MIPPVTVLHAVAQQAARQAGEHVFTQLGRRSDTDRILRHDIKHKLDREAQEVATAVIRASFPDHAILGEETADAKLPASDVRWIIDPIDGTINFTHGLPLWCCSVAAQIGEQTVAGAVFAPELGLLFEAQAGGPARCNGKPLRVSDTDRLEQALIHTGADKDDPGAALCRFLNRNADLAQRPRVEPGTKSAHEATVMSPVTRPFADWKMPEVTRKPALRSRATGRAWSTHTLRRSPSPAL